MKSTTELHKKITKINGINLSYKQGGEGDPLVLLHGFGTSSATWNSVLHLFGNGNSYYLVDLPGHGDSGRESADVYSVTYLADLISEFVLSLELQHYTMIGHSLGGIIALRFALNNYASKINRLKRLVLIDSASYHQKLPRLLRYYKIISQSKCFFDVMPKNTLAYLGLREVFYNHDKIPEGLVKEYARGLRIKGTRDALRAITLSLANEIENTPVQKYDEITIPTLIIWGEHDKLIPPEMGVKLHDDINNSQLFMVPNCGHAPQEECPEITGKILKDFIG